MQGRTVTLLRRNSNRASRCSSIYGAPTPSFPSTLRTPAMRCDTVCCGGRCGAPRSAAHGGQPACTPSFGSRRDAERCCSMFLCAVVHSLSRARLLRCNTATVLQHAPDRLGPTGLRLLAQLNASGCSHDAVTGTDDHVAGTDDHAGCSCCRFPLSRIQLKAYTSRADFDAGNAVPCRVPCATAQHLAPTHTAMQTSHRTRPGAMAVRHERA